MIQQQYVIGNAKDLKNIFINKSIPAPQLIITSPPYFDLLNYNDNTNQLGYGQRSYEEYLETICKIFQDCYDISSNTATFWLIVDTFKKNKEVKLFPFDIVNELKKLNKNHWILKDIIIWDKEKNLPWNNNGNFKNQHEYILFFTKGAGFKFNVDRVREILDLKKWWITYPERYNPDGKAPSNVWNFTTPIRGWGNSRQNHLCPFPFPLVEKIVSLCSDENDWVLDPFVGSGSVLAISKEMNRNSFGLDINQEYKIRFENEVNLGASNYWEKRKEELETAKNLIANFKQTNNKLRKLKVASSICKHLNKINKYPFVYYTKEKSTTDIEIVVLQNGQIPKVDLNNDALINLIKQCKIKAEVMVEKDNEFAHKLDGTTSYKYKLEKFFEYTSTCQMKRVIQSENKYDYIYSDIAIKVFNS